MLVDGMLVSLSCLFVFKVIPLFCTAHFHCTSFLSYFEKIQCSSNVGGLSVCIFVALCVCMCVAVASCDDGPILGWRYYELLLGTNEVFASDMTLLKVNQGLFDAAILVLHNFLVFYCGKRCLEA